MNSDTLLIVFAKAPVAGFAKTRLASVLGEQVAARLAQRMLDDSVRRAVDAGLGPVELCCTPDASHPAFLELAASFGLSLTLQGDGNLGQRMERALLRGLRTHRKALLMGTDAPELSASRLRSAAELLDIHPAVFNPALDGGYVLVGLAQPVPKLFDDIPWSTDQVMQRTRERLRASGHGFAELPPLPDVDVPTNLQTLPPSWLE